MLTLSNRLILCARSVNHMRQCDESTQYFCVASYDSVWDSINKSTQTEEKQIMIVIIISANHSVTAWSSQGKCIFSFIWHAFISDSEQDVRATRILLSTAHNVNGRSICEFFSIAYHLVWWLWYTLWCEPHFQIVISLNRWSSQWIIVPVPGIWLKKC